MKLLFCRKCFELVQLRNEVRCCLCGNVIGRYLDDDSTIQIAVKDMEHARIIGVSNNFLTKPDGHPHGPQDDGGYFAAQNSSITVIPPYDDGNNVVYVGWAEMHNTMALESTDRISTDNTDIKTKILQNQLDVHHGILNAMLSRENDMLNRIRDLGDMIGKTDHNKQEVNNNG